MLVRTLRPRKLSTQDWITRFWSKVEKTPTCWWWTAGTFADRFGERGYGAFQLNGRAQKAHRLAWMLTHGEIPEGMLVLHHCDHPSCVNPEHLYLGSAKDNAHDREARQRRKNVYGECHGRSRLTAAAVADIRARYRSVPRRSSNAAELATQYGISKQHVRALVRREKWRAPSA